MKSEVKTRLSEQIEQAIALFRDRLEQSSPTSSQLQGKIDNLQRDRAKILSLFE